MTKILRNKVTKADIANMPRADFNGRIIVVLTEKEADAAVEYLMQFPALGFDTETRPSFRPGRRYKVALLQVSTKDTCFLFRLNRFGLTPSIVRLFENNNIIKLGLSVIDDIRMLRERAEFTPGNVVEIQKVVKPLGVEDMSLQKIYANIFNKKIAKNQQLSNWEADNLSEGQKRYAALDAQACLQIYEETNKLLQTGDYELHVVEPEEQPQVPPSNSLQQTDYSNA